MSKYLRLIIIALTLGCGFEAAAQSFTLSEEFRSNLADSLIRTALQRRHREITPFDLRPAVFSTYHIDDTLRLNDDTGNLPQTSEMAWLNDELFNEALMRRVRQGYMIANPASVRYNSALLPEVPRTLRIEVDPLKARLSFVEDRVLNVPDETPQEVIAPEIEKKHWLHAFEAGLQFSQAYLSPNWYQGGSNSLTMLFNVLYGVKLNRNYHPNLLAEMTVSYKLHVTGTPEDSLRNYNITEDLFQFNGKFGFRAWRKWFYTVTGQFKTQFFKNYEVNDPKLHSAFLSPSELNLGLGMTYDSTSPKKSVTLLASISPISWNMKTCINPEIDPTLYGIKAGQKTVNEIGSSAEVKFTWQIGWNILYTSRLFAFTDYTYIQGDWENTLTFNINRFLSTQLFFHLRYDSTTPRVEASKWHKWQVKEVLSIGFAYKFSTI